MSEVKQKIMDLKRSFSQLDVHSSGEWPLPIKILAMMMLFVVIVFFGYFLFIGGDSDRLSLLENKEFQLKKAYEFKDARAVNYVAYQKQLVELNDILKGMLSQLPKKDEVSQLLLDISTVGHNNQLHFELFEPQKTIDHEFYTEIPIKIKVTGNYHEFGQFIAGITSLSRIVTVKNVTIEHRNDQNGNASNMLMELTAKTYQYKQANHKGKGKV